MNCLGAVELGSYFLGFGIVGGRETFAQFPRY
jgi:hypothetical protein